MSQGTSKKTNTKVTSFLLTPQKSVTQGTVTVEGKKINYKAVAGTLILKNKANQPTISMSYVAYFKKGAENKSQRPITFMLPGGPGGSCVLIHMGGWGPRLAYTGKKKQVLLPPYKITNNDYSLLDVSDLVFIDAPGTGFGRIISKEYGGAGVSKKIYSIDGDGKAFAQFIRLFLNTFYRWNSPKYLYGVSYGTFRSAVAARNLEEDNAIRLNGVIQTSQVLSIADNIDFPKQNPGNDLPYILALPSYTATAWCHHRLPQQPQKLKPLLKKVEEFALNGYASALLKGAMLDSLIYHHIAEQLHKYTGLPINVIEKCNLRVTGPEFEKNLLSDGELLTSRFDTQYTGLSMDPMSKYPYYDPVMAAMLSPFVVTFNNYAQSTLKLDSPLPYIADNLAVLNAWDFRHQSVYFPPVKKVPNVMLDLASAMIFNPKLKIMLNMGYFDLATPFFENVYAMKHLPIPKSLQKNISYSFYFSGHGMFALSQYPKIHKKMHDNVAKFIKNTY
jgi:carboxypeptidase C (cathepsin A)